MPWRWVSGTGVFSRAQDISCFFCRGLTGNAESSAAIVELVGGGGGGEYLYW